MTVVEPLDPSGYGDEALGIRSAQSVTYNATYGETFTETLIMFRVGRAFGLTSTVMFNRQVDADEQTTALAAFPMGIDSIDFREAFLQTSPTTDGRSNAGRAPTAQHYSRDCNVAPGGSAMLSRRWRPGHNV